MQGTPQQYTTLFNTKKVSELIDLFEKGRVNLNPDFQRNLVWKKNDRVRLIASILEGFPLPAVVLVSRTNENDDTVYDVVDGKQRIETILNFLGVGNYKETFSAEIDTRDESGEIESKTVDGNDKITRARVKNYCLYILEVPVESLRDVGGACELFIRINSTGKALTGGEINKARSFKSPFMKNVLSVAEAVDKQLKSWNVMTDAKILRYEHLSLVADLMLAFEQGRILGKDRTVTKTLEGTADTPKENAKWKKIGDETKRILNMIGRAFPNGGLASVRFRKAADFYSLAYLLRDFKKDNFVLDDAALLKIGERLSAFGSDIDRVRDCLREKKKIPEKEFKKRTYVKNVKKYAEDLKNYVGTVREGTGSEKKRAERHEILKRYVEGALGGVKKDPNRRATDESRRALWAARTKNNPRAKYIKCDGCGKNITYEEMEVDHILPHSKGGKSDLSNYQALCRSCNAAKGDRSSTRQQQLAL